MLIEASFLHFGILEMAARDLRNIDQLKQPDRPDVLALGSTRRATAGGSTRLAGG